MEDNFEPERSGSASLKKKLDIILVAFAMFSGPVTAFIATMAQRLVNDGKKGDEG